MDIDGHIESISVAHPDPDDWADVQLCPEKSALKICSTYHRQFHVVVSSTLKYGGQRQNIVVEILDWLVRIDIALVSLSTIDAE